MTRNANIQSACVAVVLSIALLLPLPLFAERAAIPAFSANYSVSYGILRGEMTLELRHAEPGYIYRTSLRPRGVVSWLRRGEIRESTSLVAGEGLVRPLDYDSVDTIAKPTRHVQYEFDPQNGRVTGEYKLREVDVPMQQDGQNRISAQVAIMEALQSGIELSELPVFDRGRWRTFQFEIIPDQLVETPAGDFETIQVRYASDAKSKSWSLYCAPSLDYLPVLIVYREKGKTKSRAELTDFLIDR
ncbi:MAG: DUF3108 domain-containing protein [Woeseiaceae bacterium]